MARRKDQRHSRVRYGVVAEHGPTGTCVLRGVLGVLGVRAIHMLYSCSCQRAGMRDRDENAELMPDVATIAPGDSEA